jgi:hypothetical protein
MIRQPDHIVAFDAERHQHLALSAQPIDLIKYLAPGQIGKTLRQGVQIAPMHALNFAENAIRERVF